MKTNQPVADQKTDPSMEDILSSIREIISAEPEETPTTAAMETISHEETSLADDRDVLDLVNMLREDDSVHTVTPFGSVQGPVAVVEDKHTVEAAGEKAFEDLAAELEEDAPKEKKPALKKKMSSSEEAALESIAQSLSEMEESDPSEGRPSLHEGAFEQLESVMDDLETGKHETIFSDDESASLLSEETLTEAADALDILSEFGNQTNTPTPMNDVGGKSVESLMKEILRPLLKDWLDANLPSMVRTVVAEQVQKIVRQKTHQNRPSLVRKAA